MTELSASEAAAALKAGDFSAEAYAEALLARAEDCRGFNVFITLEPDRVLEAARACDRARSRGEALGPLHGLPVPIKDSVNTSEYRTTNGTRALASFRPGADAEVVARLRAAGAIVMGKTHLQELSRGWTGNNGAFGAGRNPYDPERVPGGSSGGSAAAVALGIAPLALAEDTWGSIRVPAAWCGVAGFRPTVGRYPNEGTMPLTLGRFDQVGPVARTMQDIVLFDAVVTGAPLSLSSREPEAIRLGIALEWMAGVDPEVARIVEAAFTRLRSAGVQLVETQLPPSVLQASEIASTVIAYENPRAMGSFLAAQRTGVTFEALIEQASPNIRERYAAPPVGEPAYREALQARAALEAALDPLYRHERLDALVFPPLLAAAPPLGDNAEVAVDGGLLPLRTVVGRNTAMGNCASLSSLVLPVGLTPRGLPVALEFDAPRGLDRELLAIGLALEPLLGPLPAPTGPG